MYVLYMMAKWHVHVEILRNVERRNVAMEMWENDEEIIMEYEMKTRNVRHGELEERKGVK